MLEALELGSWRVEGPDTDAHLMWRMGANEEAALRVLYDRHAAVAFGLALRILKDRPSAEEVVQDAFLALWRSARAYAPHRASVRTWLLVMVRSKAIDRLRASGRSRSVPMAEQPDLVASSDTWESVALTMRGEVVRHALAQLSPDQGQILKWAYFDGLSQSEIASRSGIPLGTVKSRSRLALERLRRLLSNSIAAEGADT